MYDIVCVGDVAVDDFYRVARLPGEDEKIRASYLGTMLGGTTCNTARALLRLGDAVLFVTALGNDDNATFVRNQFASLGLSTRIVSTTGHRTFSTLVMVSAAGEKAILLFETGETSPELIEALSHVRAEETRVVFSSLIVPAFQHLEKYTVPITVSIEEPTIDKYADVFVWAKDHSHTIILDRHSFKRIFGLGATPQNLARAVPESGISAENLVVTLGPEGSAAFSRSLGEVTECSSFRAQVVDTTGAGDIFNAAFLHSYYLEGMPLEEALRFSNAAAAAACEEFGTELSVEAINKARAWSSNRR
jgi:sulfofructose kinase